jgi:hypothetical protein
MAQGGLTKEDRATIRRMLSQRIAAPHEPLAQIVSRTPNGKRFLKPRQKRLDKSKDEPSPLARSTTSSRYGAVRTSNQQILPKRTEDNTHPKGDEIKV